MWHLTPVSVDQEATTKVQATPFIVGLNISLGDFPRAFWQVALTILSPTFTPAQRSTQGVSGVLFKIHRELMFS